MSTQYNTHSFGAYATLPAPTSIGAVSGRIAKIYPPKKGKTELSGLRGTAEMRGILQNGFLKDEHTGQEVKFMLNDFYLAPADYEGGWVWFEATPEGGMTWKPQVGHPNKLEIKSGVKVRMLVAKADYHGMQNIPQAEQPPVQVRQPADNSHSSGNTEMPLFPSTATSSHPAPVAPKAAGTRTAQTPPASKQDPVDLARRVGVCARLAIEQVSWAMSSAKMADDTIGLKSETVLAHLANTAMVQLLRENAHYALNLSDYDAQWGIAVEPPARPQLALLTAHIESVGEERVKSMMKFTCTLPDTGRWQDAPEEKIAEFISKAAEVGLLNKAA